MGTAPGNSQEKTLRSVMSLSVMMTIVEFHDGLGFLKASANFCIDGSFSSAVRYMATISELPLPSTTKNTYTVVFAAQLTCRWHLSLVIQENFCTCGASSHLKKTAQQIDHCYLRPLQMSLQSRQ